MVSAGRRLEHLPALAASFASGDVTPKHVQVVAEAMTPPRLARAAEIGLEQ